MRARAHAGPAAALGCGLLLLSLPGAARAERLGRKGQIVESETGTVQTSGGSKKVDSAETNQGGGVSVTKFRHGFSVGAPVATTGLASAKYRLNPGFMAASTAQFERPLSNLDIASVTAKASAFGADIPPQTWQPDADPLFIWRAPSAGLGVAGYSWAVDAEPDTTVDTAGTALDFSTTTMARLSDGTHTFSVRAVDSAGTAGAPASIDLWVDTQPPALLAHEPSGEVLTNTAPAITATLRDDQSGVDKSAVEVFINQGKAPATFDPATGMVTATGGAWREGVNTLELRAADAVGNALTPLVWSVTLDTQPPVGTVVINGGAGATTSMYVTLSLTVQDATSGVARMRISNQRTTGYVEEPFSARRAQWALTPVRGQQAVYVKFVDRAGNESPAASDDITLSLLSPETLITNGPAGLTPLSSAAFSFLCPEGACVFAYAFDNGEWSDWAPATTATSAALPPGNHYFRVKAAKEANGVEGIQLDEEDPTPAERTWIIGPPPTLFGVPKGPPIKLWRLE